MSAAAVDWKSARKKGGELLDFWAASMKARMDDDPEHRGLFREAVPSDIAKRLEEMQSGRTCARAAKPTDVGADEWKVLQVEGAFLSIAANATESLLGKYSNLPDDPARHKWGTFQREAHRRIRGVCFDVCVLGRRPGQYDAHDTRVHLALYGRTRNGYGRIIGQTVNDVREFLGAG